MKKLKKENKGFSLVELIVVVLILGILAVAVTPQIMNWIDKSKENKDLAYAGAVATAAESVALEYYGIAGTLAHGEYILTDTGVTADGTEANAAATNAVTGQTVNALATEINDVVADFQDPEQSDMDQFRITVDLNATTNVVEVTVVAEATP